VIIAILIVAPLLALIVLGLAHRGGSPLQPFIPPGWADWATTGASSFVEVAQSLGGPILGYAMPGAAVISDLVLCQDNLTSCPRPASATAEGRLPPKVLTKAHPKCGTPLVSALFLPGLDLVLITGTFADLVVIAVMLNMFSYLLFFGAVRESADRGRRAFAAGAARAVRLPPGQGTLSAWRYAGAEVRSVPPSSASRPRHLAEVS
jgi:amino acid transporter